MNKINLQIFRSCIIVAVLVSLAVQPALADYNFEGVPYTDELADVTQGTVRGGVYVDVLSLDSESWSAYSRELAKGTSVNASVVLGVPVDYTGVGIQEGTLIFWAGAE